MSEYGSDNDYQSQFSENGACESEGQDSSGGSEIGYRQFSSDGQAQEHEFGYGQESEQEYEEEQEYDDREFQQQEQQQEYRQQERAVLQQDVASAAVGGSVGALLGGMLVNLGGASTSNSSLGWFNGLQNGMHGLNIGQQDHTRARDSQHVPASQPPQHNGGNEGRDFEYSRCTGRRRAVLVGINYFNTKGQLNGCINDVHNVTRFLQGQGYQDITILTDDSNDPNRLPTRNNIIRGMQYLTQGANRDDALFFHYSGHGIQTAGGDHTEADGKMEAICPLDYESAGLLVDRDSAYDLLVKPLPTGCRLTAVFDSCHSGTVMNLPYAYSTQGTVKEPNFMADTGKGLLRAAPQYFQGDTMGAAKALFGAVTSSFKEKQAGDALRAQNTNSADVISFSGCKDEQTSADTTEEGQATGAMSYALIKALSSHPNISYKQLLNNVRKEMIAGGYSQKPQLSACHPIDTDLQFVV